MTSQLETLAGAIRREPRATTSAALVALALLAVLASVDVLARTGWTASWYVDHEGARTELRRTTEHRLSFPNERRALSRYVTGWDFDRFGMPAALPSIDVTLRARLEVPEGGRHLVTRADGRTALRVDGAPYDARALVTPGVHDLEVDWQSGLDDAPRFALRWGPEADDLVDVPRLALTPADGAWPATRLALWALGVPLAALIASLTFLAVARGGTARRRSLAALATILVVGVGLGYRLYDYDVSPDFRENEDELFAMWNGYSLLTDGTTRGWTLWHGYYEAEGPETGTIYQAHYFYRPFHLVTPYFEHPPLLHLLVGAAGWLGGARDYLEVSLSHARLVPIALSVVVMLLMIAIGRRLDRGSPAPWLGTLLYAGLPWIALQTRVVKEEALVTPLALGSVLAFLEWRDRIAAGIAAADPTIRSRAARWLVLAAGLAALATLAKVTGIAFSLALAVLVARVGRKRDVALVLGAAALALGALALYGWALGWDAFVFAQRLQTSRPVHFNIFLRFFDDPQINHNVVGRGWLLFLWLGAMATLFARRSRDTAVLAVPLFTYFVAIALGSGTWTYGWYVTPLLPFLCLAAGRFVADLWREPELGRGAAFVLTLVFYSLNFAVGEGYFLAPLDPHEPRLLVTAVLVAFLVPLGLAQAFGWTRVGRVAVVAGLVTVLVVGGAFVGGYDVYFTSHHDFDRASVFNL
jgi:4-amino-4-deoxy-L-arabinose transferase-like glycosyltransferase